MRRWLRILMVGTLTVVMAIDSASACRLFRSRCRPRCRVVTCRVGGTTARPAGVCTTTAACGPCQTVTIPCELPVAVDGMPTSIDGSMPAQCCVPADGSARAVVEQSTIAGPRVEPTPAQSTPAQSAPVVAAPQPIAAPVPALEPVAPVSAEKPLPAEPPTTPTPVREPEFKTAAEILAEKAEQDRLEKEAAAAKATTPVVEPQFKSAAEILAESAAQEAAEKAALDAAPKPAAEPPSGQPDQPAPVETPEPAAEKPMAKEPAASEPPAEPAPAKPEENLFDEGDDLPAADGTERSPGKPMKRSPEPSGDDLENLFDEPEAPAAKDPAEEPAAAKDDPFAGILEPPAEPVRRWIDDTGRHETIGRLVEIRPDSVRILKANGRYATVPLARLSRHDLGYVTATGERLATGKAATPGVTDTARR